MNRRDFLKSIGIVGAGTAISIVPPILANKELISKKVPQISFDEARLSRDFNGQWILDFSSPELFILREQSGDSPKELIVEIGDYIFVLKEPKQIDFASYEHTSKGKVYLHQLVGVGWEQI